MKYAIATLGCKVNQFETQAIETLLAARGHNPTTAGDADAVIVNTCAVTAESGRKSRQAVRRLLRENPGAVAAVCGCFSQIRPEEAAALGEAEVKVLYGSGDRMRFVEAVEKAVAERVGETHVDNPFRRAGFEPLPAGALEGRTRAYLKIQDGCDRFCSYCVIPYARGRVRSMALADIARESARLQSEGFREIVLTGIEIASYGKDLRDGSDLADAVRAVAGAAPETRVRLGSLEPTVVTAEFCRRLRTCRGATVCPQFHLSLQSGCDKTLRAMNRSYGTARFAESAALLRAAFPGCALTADLITGFPGETEADHRETLKFLREIGFASMHVFPYSPRPGTKAAELPYQLSRAIREARAAQAQETAAELRRSFLSEQIGRTLPVLFETETAPGLWQGHADNYCVVRAGGEALHGIMKNVKITGIREQILMGNVV